jgi:tight adherence protein C
MHMNALIEYRTLVLYAGYALIGLATFILGNMLLSEQENMNASENLRQLDGKKTSNDFVRLTRPFFSQYIVPAIRSKSRFDEARLKYRRKIISGGLKDELTADEFIAFKIMLVVVFPVVGGFVRALDLADIPNYVMFFLPVIGYFYPDFWVNGRIKVRHAQVIKSMPFVVDLLALSTEAGLDFIGAIQKVVEKAAPGPFIDEMEQVLKEIKVGSSRSEALREMAFRINLQEVNSFVAVLCSADQMGASIGKVLRQQSDQIRTLRFVRAEKAGALATQKLMFPTFALILPAILIMMLMPFGLQAYMNGGGG